MTAPRQTPHRPQDLLRFLAQAASEGDLDRARHLIELGANPKKGNFLALAQAARRGDVPMLELLLPLAKSSSNRGHAFFSALTCGHAEASAFLAPHCAAALSDLPDFDIARALISGGQILEPPLFRSVWETVAKPHLADPALSDLLWRLREARGWRDRLRSGRIHRNIQTLLPFCLPSIDLCATAARIDDEPLLREIIAPLRTPSLNARLRECQALISSGDPASHILRKALSEALASRAAKAIARKTRSAPNAPASRKIL